MRFFINPRTPGSYAIDAWVLALREASQQGVKAGQGVFAQPLPPLVAQARPLDFQAAGWDFDSETKLHSAINIDGVVMEFSSDERHLALMSNSNSEVAVWLDGQPFAPPQISISSSRMENGQTAWGHTVRDGAIWANTRWGDTMWWLGERRLFLDLGLPYTHPLCSNKINVWDMFGGNMRGVFILDVDQGTQTVVLPRDDQAWDCPLAYIKDGRIVIYGTPEDRKAGRVGWTSESLDP